jgi:hypothetical protein
MPKLTVNEGAISGYTHTWEVDFNDLKTIGTGNQVTIATIPAGGAVELAVVHKLQATAGSTSVVFDIGTTGADPDEFIDALDADGMTIPVYNTGDAFTTASGTANKLILAGVVASATPILFEVNDSSVNSLTAGKWIVGLRILDLAQFAARS